jgi:hypothetical protein
LLGFAAQDVLTHDPHHSLSCSPGTNKQFFSLEIPKFSRHQRFLEFELLKFSIRFKEHSKISDSKIQNEIVEEKKCRKGALTLFFYSL